MTGRRGRIKWLSGGSQHGWGRSERGSVTLEAAVVFPWILLITFFLLLLSVLAMKKVTVYYTATAAAERAAFSWGHSSSDVRTGAYPEGKYDGLYWRLADDAALSGLFGMDQVNGETRIPLASPATESEGSLTSEKLAKTARSVPLRLQGTAGYRNQLWRREIRLDTQGISVRSVVSEPAEWVRTFHLIRYYQAKMKSYRQGKAAYREQAASVLKKR